MQNQTLDQILGRTTKILGTNKASTYSTKLSKLSPDQLWEHGKKEYSLLRKFNENRESFESKCVSAFSKKLTNGVTVRDPIPRKLKKSDQTKLDEFLGRIK